METINARRSSGSKGCPCTASATDCAAAATAVIIGEAPLVPRWLIIMDHGKLCVCLPHHEGDEAAGLEALRSLTADLAEGVRRAR